MIAILIHACFTLLPRLSITVNAAMRPEQRRLMLVRGCVALLLVGASPSVIAQQKSSFDVPTPNAGTLGEYGQVPVNFFNGLPSIAVPLHTFKYLDITIPIELNYHAGGNRPENYPGWVGLGWNLDAGGAVTRIVNGRPDEITVDEMNEQKRGGYNYPSTREYGYFFRSNEFARSDWASQTFLTDYLNSSPYNWLPLELGPFDGEPDEFLFNAGDMSGSFFMYRDVNNALQFKIKSKSGEYLKIEQILSTSSTTVNIFEEITDYSVNLLMRRSFMGFTITRADGTKYYFGSDMNAMDINGTPGEGVLATSWYLTKIESPKGYSVNLEYKRQGDIFVKSTSRTRKFLYIKDATNCAACSDLQRSYTLQHPSYLSRITAPDGSAVDFISAPSSQLTCDFNVFPRDHEMQFAVLNPNGYFDPRFLTYNYLLQLNQIKVKGGRNISFSYVNSATQRLRLGSVEVTNDIDASSFKYQFTYNPLFLPAYNSKMTDNWGYYNGQYYGNVMNSSTAASFNQQLYDFRSPDATLMQAEILQTIIYPTGGRTTFEFEPHDYSQIAQQYPFLLAPAPGTGTGTAGGLRIRRITSRTSITDSQPQVWEYLYKNTDNSSSEILSGIPLYEAEGKQYASYSYSQWSGLVYYGSNSSFTQNYVILSENAQNPLSNTNGNHITYSRVVEKRTGQGYTVYRYTNTDTRDVSGTPLYNDQDPEGGI